MKDTQILSTFQNTAPDASSRLAVLPFVFDACQLGVVLRAVLLVELAVGTGVMFVAQSTWDGMARFALVTGGALPATVVWLLVTCSLKNLLRRLQSSTQYAIAISMGSAAGVYGCAMLWWSGLLERPPWGAAAASGAFLSAILVAALVMRAKGRLPADTTARLTELQSRIRPHFLFNTLNSAISLVRAEPAKAETLLEDLSDLFRHALLDRGDSVTLADEILLAKRYLAIEQVRFGGRLRVQWLLDDAANTAKLPPLLLQPLVENAVHHGVEPSESGADLQISTELRGPMVVIKVTNTVPAGPGETGQGLALRNVRDRLGLLHDVEGHFKSGYKKGMFQVRIEVPA
ncbi:sensor histidine kinase [Rhodoferax aquaticus]|uniref:Sensor histidine kinase n=1 Tax=Rhodoferax aquaticus TaxID=2527691 RepID=A0A515ES09_9BURK|nr:sensor histidine kinase [Rhodoferax aquaticus]QDL55445.1 sensor histidine kinase [Rhodoferax aquaticus]